MNKILHYSILKAIGRVSQGCFFYYFVFFIVTLAFTESMKDAFGTANVLTLLIFIYTAIKVIVNKAAVEIKEDGLLVNGFFRRSYYFKWEDVNCLLFQENSRYPSVIVEIYCSSEHKYIRWYDHIWSFLVLLKMTFDNGFNIPAYLMSIPPKDVLKVLENAQTEYWKAKKGSI